MPENKPNERQRLLEGRMTAIEADARALNAKLDELADQVAMMGHHMQRLREGDPVVSRRHH